MIDCVSVQNAHLHGDALAAQFRLRHRVFIRECRWNLPTWQGMEFDQFDTPATTYFVWRNSGGEARGIARIAPTLLPYMLEKLWPHLVTVEPLPHDAAVWEGSRIGIDPEVRGPLRRRILAELICAYLEFSLEARIDRFLVLMPVAFLKRILAANGWHPTFLGPETVMEGARVAAASLKVSSRILENVRANMGVEGPVLRGFSEASQQKAA